MCLVKVTKVITDGSYILQSFLQVEKTLLKTHNSRKILGADTDTLPKLALKSSQTNATVQSDLG